MYTEVLVIWLFFASFSSQILTSKVYTVGNLSWLSSFDLCYGLTIDAQNNSFWN